MRIAGGLVVAPEGVRPADVVVADGRVDSVVPHEPAGPGDLDARGCVVLPGGVDPHTHLLSDIAPATVSALHGGTTTALSFTAPRPGESPAAAYARASDELVPLAAVDVPLHPAIWEPDLLTRESRQALARLGARSIKHYLAYPELGMMTSDRALYESLRDAMRLGLLTMVHCENGGAIAARVAEALADGRTDLHAFVWTRPPDVEEEAVARTLALARLAGAPVYLVHLSSVGSLDQVRAARAHGQQVWAEACTHHLLLDGGVYERPDAARWLIVPPLRERAHVDALWEAVADGTIDAVGSDHAQTPYRPDLPGGDFRSLPYGFPGVEARLSLVLSEGRRRDIPLERLVDVLAANPARAFGLYPRKGALAPGADADVVVWDPAAEWTVEPAALHDGTGATPYEGIHVEGRLRAVVRRGEPIALE